MHKQSDVCAVCCALSGDRRAAIVMCPNAELSNPEWMREPVRLEA